MKFVTQRTETVRVVISDCTASCFGNDGVFLTVFDRSAAVVNGTGGPYWNSPQKVFPLRCHKRCHKTVIFSKTLTQSGLNLTFLTVLSKTRTFAALRELGC